MKVRRLLMALLFALIPGGFGHALDLSLGVTGWYTRWDPHFEDDMRGEDNPLQAAAPKVFGEAYNDSISFRPAFMAGPLAGATIGKWTLGGVFLASTGFKGHSNYQVYYLPDPGVTYDTDFRFQLKRYDADGTLEYRLNDRIGCFAGYKYSHYRGSGTYQYWASDSGSVIPVDVRRKGTMHGPGLGVKGTIPLGEAWHITASLSFLVLKARWVYESTNLSSGVYREKVLTPALVGANATAGLGYYFRGISTTCVLGGRYQHLVSTDERGMRDRFYGVTLTAVYAL